jgi:hypothetical protein
LANQDGNDGDSAGEESQDLRELPTKRRRVPELAAIEGGVSQKDDQAIRGNDPEDGQRRKAGRKAKEQGKRNSNEKGEEFGEQEGARAACNLIKAREGTGDLGWGGDFGSQRTVRSHITI